MAEPSFSARLIDWYARHGRHDLPWQAARTPYRVWLSEIMLQQTQVTTVIPYFERFVARCPTVQDLAAAAPDEVLHLWSGLGYYSRARNLHRCAQLLVARHGGEFPRDLDTLMALPGIGRSTAAAILAQAYGLPHAILDGNVKRVLARYHALAGWPGAAPVMQQLWRLSEQHLPQTEVRDYTQAIMDLGATLCTRSRPRCGACPVASNCAGHQSARVQDYPTARPKRVMPRRSTCFLIIENAAGQVLLERRPPSGVWGGLWCFPEVPHEDALSARLAALGLGDGRIQQRLAVIAHSFTHFHLDIAPLRIAAEVSANVVRDAAALRWYSPADSTRIGLSAPVARLLASLRALPPQRLTMSTTVQCIKLGREEAALTAPPYPGELGKRIFANVSKPGWQLWLAHQTMLINENRLTPIDPKDRAFLVAEMEKFFFGDGSAPPEGYVPPKD